MEKLVAFNDFANTNSAFAAHGVTPGYADLLAYLSEGRFLAEAHAMGLTTRPRFFNGTPRTPVPNPNRCDLGDGPSFLWGRVNWIYSLDVGDHIGNADDDLRALVMAA